MKDLKKRIAALSDEEIRESLLLGESGYQDGVFTFYEEEAKKRNLEIDYKNIPSNDITSSSFFAPPWKRAFNYLIDAGLCYYIPLRLFFYEPVRNAAFSVVFAMLIMLGIMLLYYVLCERFLGKTLGKLITRTTVIAGDSKKPGLGEIIKRTFSRLIPFNWLVTISTGKGLHDRLSKTICIEDRRIDEFRELVKQSGKHQEPLEG